MVLQVREGGEHGRHRHPVRRARIRTVREMGGVGETGDRLRSHALDDLGNSLSSLT